MKTTHLTIALLMTVGCGVEPGADTETANGGLGRGKQSTGYPPSEPTNYPPSDPPSDPPSSPPSYPSSIPSTGMVPKGCERIEGAQIGQAGLKVTLGGGVTVTFTGWTYKDGEDEAIGFSFDTTGGTVSYAVKASGETHHGNGSPWTHPGGTRGSSAPGISNITICPDPPGGGGTGGSGGYGTGGSGGYGGTGGSTGTGGTGGGPIIID